MSKSFTKLSKEIQISVKENGPSPESNSKLRALIQNAKSINIITHNVSDDETLKGILSGQKTKSFYANISTNGKTTDCTIDGHSYNVWNGTVTTLRDVPNMTPKTYKLIQDDYRKAAMEISSITESETGEILTASEIQAITWVAYRRIHKNLI